MNPTLKRMQMEMKTTMKMTKTRKILILIGNGNGLLLSGNRMEIHIISDKMDTKIDTEGVDIRILGVLSMAVEDTKTDTAAEGMAGGTAEDTKIDTTAAEGVDMAGGTAEDTKTDTTEAGVDMAEADTKTDLMDLEAGDFTDECTTVLTPHTQTLY
jgi:hypothetical protein